MPLVYKHSEKIEKAIQAAGKLFARQGYHGTSTREIAQLGEVSENTLFRHFDHKEDLFWAAIRWHLASLKHTRDLLKGIAQNDSPEIILPKIIGMLTDTVGYRSDLIRLIAVAYIELPMKAEEFFLQYFSPVFSSINHYLEMNIRSGKIRDMDSTMLTSVLIMTALMHPGIYNLIRGINPLYSNSPETHSEYAKFWLELTVPRMPVDASQMAQLGGEYLG
ncbi:MAG: TetR/AcrR family transcriptional regulator [Terracidiphilus sp.]